MWNGGDKTNPLPPRQRRQKLTCLRACVLRGVVIVALDTSVLKEVNGGESECRSQGGVEIGFCLPLVVTKKAEFCLRKRRF